MSPQEYILNHLTEFRELVETGLAWFFKDDQRFSLHLLYSDGSRHHDPAVAGMSKSEFLQMYGRDLVNLLVKGQGRDLILAVKKVRD